MIEACPLLTAKAWFQGLGADGLTLASAVPKNPELCQRWLTFLRNHREAIAAMDFFTVQTLTFGALYCFFVISHGRRKILSCTVTRNPSAFWIVQQMREAWPYALAQKFLIFDRDAKFGNCLLYTSDAADE